MSETQRTRLARCGCGALTAQTRGEPKHVYLCACRACQIKSGSAFTYAALFSEGDVTLSGEHKAWRHKGDSGQWVESPFLSGLRRHGFLLCGRISRRDRRAGRMLRGG